MKIQIPKSGRRNDGDIFMGGRGASSGMSAKGKKYGTEYRSLAEVGNIKFVKYNDSKSAKTPMETMTKGRVYATLNAENKVRAITLYSKSGKRVAQIDVDGKGHYVNGVKLETPHIHLGYIHDENGTRRLNEYEKKLVKKVKDSQRYMV